MEAERWRQVRARVEALVELEPEARARELAAIGEPALREAVGRLLQRMLQADTLLDQGGAALAAAHLARIEPDADLHLGRQLGPYRIEALLGAGGMGRVYRASRQVDGLAQQVAIKLVLSADPALQQRFLKERAILSGLRHPGIAALIDLGSTPEGLPFLVMEYVEGEPLGEYCARRRLTLQARLRLLLRITQSLAHAHRSLVIHRDLKPGNILVTPDGDPILLDFGIAKLADPVTGEELTLQGPGPMTPAFAAPEQFRGEPVSVATDIYQFGVLSYRLLSGQLPYPGDPADPHAWARAVVEAEPRTLSRALREQREASGAVRASEVGRDLDAILRKALAKDPQARYSSIDALAADLQAYLDGRPVQARAGGVGYAAWRFVQRHALAVGFGVASAAGLAGLTLVALQQSREARAEADRARAAVDFINEVFRAADPSGGNRTGGIGELLEIAADAMQPRLAAHPDLRAPLNGLIAGAWLRVGRVDRALPLYERAVADLSAQDISPVERLQVLEGAALAAQRSGRRELAMRWAEAAEALLPRVDAEQAARSLDVLAMVRWANAIEDGRYAESLVIAEAGRLAAERIATAEGELLLMRAYNRIAVSQASLGAHDQAAAAAAATVALAEKRFGPAHPHGLTARGTQAWVALRAGDGPGALAILEPLGESLKALRGETSQSYAVHLGTLGEAYALAGDPARAIRTLREAAAAHVASAGPDAAQAGDALLLAARLAFEQGEVDEAAALLDAVEGHWRQSVAADAPLRVDGQLLLARVRMARGERERAGAALEAAASLAEQHADADRLAAVRALRAEWGRTLP